MSASIPTEEKPETYCIVTYGCQMNDNDSEIMAGLLEKQGLRRIENEHEADVVLVNTCVVREGAEERAVGRSVQPGRLGLQHRDRPRSAGDGLLGGPAHPGLTASGG